jgi:hypothetical protein
MTKIKNNAMLKGLRGKFGDTHTYKKIRGKTHMVNLPDTPEELSPVTKAFNERFTRAAKYAKARLQDSAMFAEYQTGITPKKNSAYLVAVSDSLNAPKVSAINTSDYIGAVGNDIRITAKDDFKVIRVRVIITGAGGIELERGEAVQDAMGNEDIWHYAATVANPSVAGTTISVTAFDHPANETTLEKVL